MQEQITKLGLEAATMVLLGRKSEAVSHLKAGFPALIERYAAAHPLQAVRFGLFSRKNVQDLTVDDVRKTFGEWLGDQSDETLQAFVTSVTSYAYAGETVYEFLKSGRLFEVLAIVQQTGQIYQPEQIDLSHLENT